MDVKVSLSVEERDFGVVLLHDGREAQVLEERGCRYSTENVRDRYENEAFQAILDLVKEQVGRKKGVAYLSVSMTMEVIEKEGFAVGDALSVKGDYVIRYENDEV